MSNLIPFQWSKKLDDGTIYMVQAETADELLMSKTEIESKFLAHIPKELKTTVTDPVTQITKTVTKYNCNDCGAEATLKEGISKKGNHYKIMKCSIEESHDRFMK